jgi:hypothetical protein
MAGRACGVPAYLVPEPASDDLRYLAVQLPVSGLDDDGGGGGGGGEVGGGG